MTAIRQHRLAAMLATGTSLVCALNRGGSETSDDRARSSSGPDPIAVAPKLDHLATTTSPLTLPLIDTAAAASGRLALPHMDTDFKPGTPTSSVGRSSLVTVDLNQETANDRLSREIARYSEASEASRQAMGQILVNRRGVNRLEENIYVRILREDQVTADELNVGVDSYIKNVGDGFVILGIENYMHAGSVIRTTDLDVQIPQGAPFPEIVDPEQEGRPNTRAISRRMVREGQG
jgi:hypothetical protein